MLTQFLDILNDKINQVNKMGTSYIESFVNFIIDICVDKVMNISNSNYI